MKNKFSFLFSADPRQNALYIHIPFCLSKCRYCDFFSLPGQTLEIMERTTEKTILELFWFCERLSVDEIKTVYIGGGTPSILPRRLLEKLFKRVGLVSCKPPLEWTVEANPESLSPDFLRTCAEYGVTRLSLGIQSFDDRALVVLGRAGNSQKNSRALDLLDRFWQGDVSLDLMTGIPGQSVDDALRDLETALAASPGHLSIYSLALEDDTELADLVSRGVYSMPSAQEAEELWMAVRRRITAAGYRHYEISNFARPGKECSHNLSYWRLDPYIGVGPGAVSTLKANDGRVVRLSSTSDLGRFLSDKPDEYLSVEKIDPKALLLEQLMMGLRLETGISRVLFKHRFSLMLENLVPGMWEDWQKRGLCRADRLSYRCTVKGRLALNRLLIEAAEKIDRVGCVTGNWP